MNAWNRHRTGRAALPQAGFRPGAGMLLIAFCIALLAHRGASPANVNVLIITLDTTRADRIGAYGNRRVATPNLDWLAATGVLFEQATTVAPLTLPAHCSLFTARFPPGHGVRDNDGFALAPTQVTLAAILHTRGFRSAAFTSSVVLDHRAGLNRGFDLYDDDFGEQDAKSAGWQLRRRGSDTVDRAIGWLAASRSSPFFAWVHLYDAHAPYDPPEPYRTEYADRPYDASVAFIDAQVGRLIGWLSRHGELERTVIVVMADHGESLGEHGEWTHALKLYQPVLHVPLIIRAPARARSGRRVGALVRTVDVMPTVLSLLGIARPRDIDGVSLLPLLTGAAGDLGLEAYAETLYPELRLGLPAGRMIRAGRMKLIRQDRIELYDVVGDPDETHNLAAANPRIVERLVARLNVVRGQDGGPAPQTPIDSDRRRRLAALGYIGR